MGNQSVRNIFFVLLGVVFCDARQSFEEEPSYREVNPGEDATLTCRHAISHMEK